MKQSPLPESEKYIRKHQHKKKYNRLAAFLAVVVVLCTTYLLILPAITMEKPYDPEVETEYICGKEQHLHSEACFDEEGSLVCQLQEHEHTSECISEPISSVLPTLSDDDAYIAELVSSGSNLIDTQDNYNRKPMTIKKGERVSFPFSLSISSYSDKKYVEGRIKLEFVLPAEEEQASFDLESMAWIDKTEGFESALTKELRTIGENDVNCQVLTAWMLLGSSDGNETVIPGEVEANVVVELRDMAPGEKLAVFISAAMEHNSWDGFCETHQTEERVSAVTDSLTVITSFTEEEILSSYELLEAEVEALETAGSADEAYRQTANELLLRLSEIYKQGKLSDEAYLNLCERVNSLLSGDNESIAEAAVGSNWMLLRDSGWFEEYSGYTSDESYISDYLAETVNEYQSYALNWLTAQSDVQVDDYGGTNSSDEGAVSVSKTISGTELENVFDITLQAQTSINISEIQEEPDMAVVIVMDISNTMKSDFGDTTRYEAAMSAAEEFLDKFAKNNSMGISKIGYVAFNTDAHKIFDLKPCSNQEQADSLKNIMRTQTGNIINANGYNESHTRFTNVEAGLAMGADMLSGVSNKNKFIIFLSDGFPTTYISSGYSGYDPYDSTGTYFYDYVLKKKCLYGTSYSDKAAIRAREKAMAIKESGVTIFSIGVDVSGQTIQQYITQSENASGFSVVDRTGTTYEIGAPNSTEAYKNWLKTSIGSNYYYDSTNQDGLYSAYNQIFAEIKHKVEQGAIADWVTTDPLPTVNGVNESLEFIGFYTKTPELVGSQLTGEHTDDGENTAVFNEDSNSIDWDLKQSGYECTYLDDTTIYTYQLVYRVRLKNEADTFTEGTIYETNGPTYLQYRSIQNNDGNLTISEPKTVNYPIPSVHGYLSHLQFKKVDTDGNSIEGAEFTLSHDTRNCSICRGNGTAVSISDQVAVSGADGSVSFADVPSGHKYTLNETKVPDGYSATGDSYIVEVSYDQITVTVTTIDGIQKEWDGNVVNRIYYELPATGGTGTIQYTLAGVVLILASSLLLYSHIKRKKEDSKSS